MTSTPDNKLRASKFVISTYDEIAVETDGEINFEIGKTTFKISKKMTRSLLTTFHQHMWILPILVVIKRILKTLSERFSIKIEEESTTYIYCN